MTDLEPGLVSVQSRHYDQTLGRFVRADAVLLASLVTQGRLDSHNAWISFWGAGHWLRVQVELPQARMA